MNTVSIDALRPEIWQKELYADVIDNLYFTKNGMMGMGENNIVQFLDELKKSKGDTITLGLSAKLGPATGVAGDGELEGNESALSYYSEAIGIDQWRDAVRLTGKLDEQKMAFDMRKDGKSKLSVRMQEFIERQIFLKLGGVINPSITDNAGNVLGLLSDGSSMLTWSNTPDYYPDADTAAGSGDRYLCASSSGTDAMASTDLITPALISKAKIKAQLASPKIKPLRIDGKNYYIMFIHPYQAYDLKRNAEFAQANREAMGRGSDNPLFTGALGMWDGVVIHEHEYVPWLDISEAGYSFRAAAAGTQANVDVFRALLCGQQAAAFAKCKTSDGWVEENFDYKNKVGFSVGLIGGVQKVMFNSKEYGVIAVDTAATDLG